MDAWTRSCKVLQQASMPLVVLGPGGAYTHTILPENLGGSSLDSHDAGGQTPPQPPTPPSPPASPTFPQPPSPPKFPTPAHGRLTGTIDTVDENLAPDLTGPAAAAFFAGFVCAVICFLMILASGAGGGSR